MNNESIDFKRIGYIVVTTGIAALILLLVMSALDYVNAEAIYKPLGGVNLFLKNYWIIIVAFIFFVSVWDYLYELFERQLKYIKPAVNSIEIMFGLWLVVIILYGMSQLIPYNESAQKILIFIHDFYFQQFMIIFLLLICISYAKFFTERK